MAVTNPKRSDLTAYAGNTFDFLYTFEDQNAAAIDLSADYNDIEFRIFQSGSKASPYVSLTVGNGLSITNTNELSGTITASQTDNAPSVLFYEIVFTLSDGSTEVYLFGRFFVNNFTGDGEKTAEFTITVNQNTNTVTFSESYDAAAKATQAKVDAEAAESNAQTIANNFDGDFDITNLQAGDILRAEDTGGGDIKLVRENEQEFLNSSEILHKSPINPLAENVIIWDSFTNRTGGLAGTNAHTGESWIDLIGDGYTISSGNFIHANSDENVSVVERTEFGTAYTDSSRGGGSVKVFGTLAERVNNPIGFVMAIDANNYIRFRFSDYTLNIDTCVDGTITVIADNSFVIGGEFNSWGGSGLYVEASYFQYNGSSTAFLNIPELDISIGASMDSIESKVTSTNLKYLGVYSSVGGTSQEIRYQIRNFGVQNYSI